MTMTAPGTIQSALFNLQIQSSLYFVAFLTVCAWNHMHVHTNLCTSVRMYIINSAVLANVSKVRMKQDLPNDSKLGAISSTGEGTIQTPAADGG